LPFLSLLARFSACEPRLGVRCGAAGPSSQFELEIQSLDQCDQFRKRGIESDKETAKSMHGFSETLISPPTVELLRIQDS
jgi:hypothetical protein